MAAVVSRRTLVVGAVATVAVAIVGVAAFVLWARTEPEPIVGEGVTALEAGEAVARAQADSPGATVTVTESSQEGDWALLSGSIDIPGFGHSADGVAFIAHREGDRWLAVPPGSEQGRQWLCQAPVSVVPAELVEYYLGPDPCS